MVSTTIICGGNENQRKEEIKLIINRFIKITDYSSSPDVFFLTSETSVGIEQVRQLEAQLLLKPYQEKYKVAVVEQAEKLTVAAQNALLKTLEEPPRDTIIILGIPNLELLLPTIISRCQVVKTQTIPEDNVSIKEDDKLFEQILKSKTGERILLAGEYGRNKEDALQFLKKQLMICRNRLRKFHEVEDTKRLHKIQEAISLINKNINPSLVIGELLLKY